MIEKEIKILSINKKKVVAKLEELWAIKKFEGYVHDIYYDFPKGKIDEEGRSFRVRNKGGEHIYTIKQKQKTQDIKKMRSVIELEHKITNVESFKKVLEKYGLAKSREKKKFRISYTLGDIVFDIDKYAGIPWLLEIEAVWFLTVKSYLEKLGLKNHEHKNFGSRGLFKFYWLSEKNGKKIQKKIKKKVVIKKKRKIIPSKKKKS